MSAIRSLAELEGQYNALGERYREAMVEIRRVLGRPRVSAKKLATLRQADRDRLNDLLRRSVCVLDAAIELRTEIENRSFTVRSVRDH